MRIPIAALILCMSSVSALAAGGGGAVREACKADVSTLCQGIEPGGGRIRACLRSNKDKLSEGCKSAIVSARQARKAAKAAGDQAALATQAPVVP